MPRLRTLVLCALVALSLVTAAQAGASERSRTVQTAYARQLTAACTDMRKQIEALGMPNKTPIAKVYPGTVKIGRAFLKRIAKLEPPLGGRANAKAMAHEYGYWFDGLALGYAILTKRNSQSGFVQTVEAAVANRRLAEGFARKLGAPGCARQPFE